MSLKGGNGSTCGPIRCAPYTRKSTTDGLDSGFSTLDAQREACELYVRSQAGQGWEVLPERYDDGGFTGANLDRPALTRLLGDIEAGRVDKVVVYKVDRLSRSILDFARLIELFDKHRAGFVSITESFDTSSSMGRLVLNVLLSFAQFERELISERTRDKIQAARKKGRWTGGKVVLGYRVSPEKRGLTVVPEEAKLVRMIFDLYLGKRSIGEVARALNDLGHLQRQKGKGGLVGPGRPWDKNAVHRILRNPLYAGMVRTADGVLHTGEHEAIVSLDVFEVAGRSLDDRTTGPVRRSRKAEYLLTGLLRCGPCKAAMTSSASKGRAGGTFRYYRCVRQQAEGIRCPTGLLNAQEVEQAVVGQVKTVVARPELKQAVQARLETQEATTEDALAAQRRLGDQMASLEREAQRLLSAFRDEQAGGKLLAGRLGEIEAETDDLRRQRASLDHQIAAANAARVDAERVSCLLDSFDRVWDVLVPEERRELLHLMVREVVVDLDHGGLRIALYDLGEGATATDSLPEDAIA